MAYIPEGARWYVAELVEEITVAGEPLNVVHKNLVLVRADSPQEAYDKALALGREGETSYKNPADQQVHIRFRGLGELSVVHDELNHGTELLYEEHIGVAEDKIEKWVVQKDRLTVFRPASRQNSPDYSDRDIVREANRLCDKPSE